MNAGRSRRGGPSGLGRDKVGDCDLGTCGRTVVRLDWARWRGDPARIEGRQRPRRHSGGPMTNGDVGAVGCPPTPRLDSGPPRGGLLGAKVIPNRPD